MSSLGLRGIIWDTTPGTWQEVILKKKMKSAFVDAVYKCIPKNRTGNNWIKGRTWLKCYCINRYLYHIKETLPKNSEVPQKQWDALHDAIYKHLYNCN